MQLSKLKWLKKESKVGGFGLRFQCFQCVLSSSALCWAHTGPRLPNMLNNALLFWIQQRKASSGPCLLLLSQNRSSVQRRQCCRIPHHTPHTDWTARGLWVLLISTCHFDVPCSLGNAVFNHIGVRGVGCNVAQKRNHFHSDVLRVQLIAGVGSMRQALPSVAVCRPAHSGLREPARCFAVQCVPAATGLHVDPGGAEGLGREARRIRTVNIWEPGPTCLLVPVVPHISHLSAACGQKTRAQAVLES